MIIPTSHTSKPKTRPPEDSLGFGKYFSDHMFVAHYSEKKGWHSPELMPYQDFKMDPGAAVLHYGQALFEGMKAFRGTDGRIRLFRIPMNAARLNEGAARLCMQAPPLALFTQGLHELVAADKSWIPSAPGTSLYLRPTLIGTEAFLGVRPATEFLFYIIASPVGGYYGNASLTPIDIWVEQTYSRAAPGGIGATKAGGNYASSLIAAVEAKKRGYAQVLWTDSSQHSHIEEVGTMNVFFVFRDEVITPPLGGTILPGVMRDSTIQVLKKMGHKVTERPIALAEVLAGAKSGELKEAFGSGTAAAISSVGTLGTQAEKWAINQHRVGPITQKLYQYFQDLNYGRSPDELGWMHDHETELVRCRENAQW